MGFSLIEAAVAAAIVVILVAIGWGAYSEYQRPTIELKNDDWECVKYENRTHLQPMWVGKTMIMTPLISTVCVEYKRHAG